MKKIILFLLMVVFTVNVFAVGKGNNKNEKNDVETVQTTFMLKGTIIDSRTNEAVAGATVLVDGEKYYSDFSGNFSIPTLIRGKHIVSIDFISYQSKVMEIDINKNQELNIEIQQH